MCSEHPPEQALLDTQVAYRQYIGSAEGEDQEHVDCPASDSPDGDQRVGDLLVAAV